MTLTYHEMRQNILAAYEARQQDVENALSELHRVEGEMRLVNAIIAQNEATDDQESGDSTD